MLTPLAECHWYDGYSRIEVNPKVVEIFMLVNSYCMLFLDSSWFIQIDHVFCPKLSFSLIETMLWPDRDNQQTFEFGAWFLVAQKDSCQLPEQWSVHPKASNVNNISFTDPDRGWLRNPAPGRLGTVPMKHCESWVAMGEWEKTHRP